MPDSLTPPEEVDASAVAPSDDKAAAGDAAAAASSSTEDPAKAKDGETDPAKEDDTAVTTPPPEPTFDARPPSLPQPPSPTPRQNRDLRAGRISNSLQILFLTGEMAGVTLDLDPANGSFLGTGINSISESQNPSWEPVGGQGLKNALEFKSLSNREISFSLTFYDYSDVIPLKENLAWLQTIGASETTPPKVSLTFGSQTVPVAVCTGMSWETDEPTYGENSSYRQSTVSLTFLEYSGPGSTTSLGQPLAPTPLNDYLQTTSLEDRQRVAQTTLIDDLLLPCIGEAESAKLKEMVENGQMKDAAALYKLSDNTVFQLAVGGALTPEIIKDEQISGKLKRAGAIGLASTEPGVTGDSATRIAAALLNKSPDSLTTDERLHYDQLLPAYERIEEGISKGNMSKTSALFQREEGDGTDGSRKQSEADTTGAKITRFASCGLNAGTGGGLQGFQNSTKEESNKSKEVTRFLDTNPPPAIIAQVFKIPLVLVSAEELGSTILAHSPYVSRENFVKSLTNAGVEAIQLQAAWDGFTVPEKYYESIGLLNAAASMDPPPATLEEVPEPEEEKTKRIRDWGDVSHLVKRLLGI